MKHVLSLSVLFLLSLASFAQTTESPTSVSVSPSQSGRSNYNINSDGSITTHVRVGATVTHKTLVAGGVAKVNNVSPDGTGNVQIGSDQVAEGTTNKYYSDLRVTTVGDTRYPQVGSVYNNPSWIGSLSAGKVSGLSAVATTGLFNDLNSRPTSIAGYGIADADPYTAVATYAAMNALTFAASTGRRVLVANDENYGDTNAWYMVWADSAGAMHAKRIVTIAEK